MSNPARGEVLLHAGGMELTLRPSFAALVAAEEELGPLFGLVDRAASGGLRLAEIVGLFWHCIADRPDGLTRAQLGDAVATMGMTAVTPALVVLLRQILSGR